MAAPRVTLMPLENSQKLAYDPITGVHNLTAYKETIPYIGYQYFGVYADALKEEFAAIPDAWDHVPELPSAAEVAIMNPIEMEIAKGKKKVMKRWCEDGHRCAPLSAYGSRIIRSHHRLCRGSQRCTTRNSARPRKRTTFSP